MPATSFDLSLVTYRAATPSRWVDVETLFGDRGACAGCWCMFLRLRRTDWEAGRGERNKKGLARLIASGARPGVIAYWGRQPIGWCAVAPREQYTALERSRNFKPIDDQPAWAVTCFFVAAPYRRLGLSVGLVNAAVQLAAKHGARMVEGYPSVPKSSRTADAFVWRGTPSVFARAGFREVARRSAASRIMRREL